LQGFYTCLAADKQSKLRKRRAQRLFYDKSYQQKRFLIPINRVMKIDQLEINKKIVKSLEKAYAKLIEFKKEKKSDLVIMKDGKIVHIKPEDLK
jgi:hypothetical protein